MKKNQTGSAILITIIILSVVLVSALSVAFVTIQEFKGSKGASKSSTTYQIADEGVEIVMYEIVKGEAKTVDDLDHCQSSGKIEDSGFVVTLFDKDDQEIDCTDSRPVSDVKKIKSVGTLEKQTQRSISAFVPLSCNDETDDSYTSLLLHFDGGDNGEKFVDATGDHEGDIATEGGVEISKEESVFCSSGYFDGTDGYLSIDKSGDWDFGEDTFTIDLWIFPEDDIDSGDDDQALLGHAGYLVSPYGGWDLRIKEKNKLEFNFYDGSGNVLDSIDTSDNVINSQEWNHVAITKDGEDIKVYVNGEKEADADDFKDCVDSDTSLEIGAVKDDSEGGDETFFFKGYMDELRISHDVVRWDDDNCKEKKCFDVPEYPY